MVTLPTPIPSSGDVNGAWTYQDTLLAVVTMSKSGANPQFRVSGWSPAVPDGHRWLISRIMLPTFPADPDTPGVDARVTLSYNGPGFGGGDSDPSGGPLLAAISWANTDSPGAAEGDGVASIELAQPLLLQAGEMLLIDLHCFYQPGSGTQLVFNHTPTTRLQYDDYAQTGAAT